MPATHLTRLVQRIPELAECHDAIEAAYDCMRRSFKSGGKLLLCGNGGSAADADHWAGELLKGFKNDRPLSATDRKKLSPAACKHLQGALPAIPLTGFPALTSAFGNDVLAEMTYAQLTWALGRRGDVLVALSTSGNARNVCHAAEVARARGLHVVALTGASGGRLLGLSEIAIRAPATETYRVQEYHLPIYHCLSLMLEDTFFE